MGVPVARHIAPDAEGYVYRAIVDYEYAHREDGKVFTEVFGPYTNVGTARSQITRETTGRMAQWRKNPRGCVERARIVWEEVK